MIQYLQRLLQERASLTEVRTRMADSAAQAERDLSTEEQTQIAEMAQRCADIDAQLTKYNEQNEADRAFAALVGKFREPDELPAPRNQTRRTENDYHSPGELFTASDAFRSYPGSGQGARFTMPAEYLQLRAAIMTSDLNIPPFQWVSAQPALLAPLLELISHVRVSSGVVEWTSLDSVIEAAVVAEGALKPEAALTWTPHTSSLDTLAHYIAVTRQALEDATYIQSLIENQLRQGVINKMESDAGAALTGATYGNTVTGASGDSLATVIRIGIGEVENDGFRPNAVALNPADYAQLDIDNAANTNQGSVRTTSVWGLRTVATSDVAAGTAYVGDFTSGITQFDRGVSNVFMTDSHADFFLRNQLVILAEARVKTVVSNTNAIAKCVTTP